jgi:hypothetical protein
VVVIRNIILLLILGTVPDHTVAADLALHFWYSALIPSQYASLLSEIIAKFIETLKNVDEDHVSMLKPLGQNSTLSGKVKNSVVAKLVTMWSAQYDFMDVGKEVERVRWAIVIAPCITDLIFSLGLLHLVRTGMIVHIVGWNHHTVFLVWNFADLDWCCHLALETIISITQIASYSPKKENGYRMTLQIP